MSVRRERGQRGRLGEPRRARSRRLIGIFTAFPQSERQGQLTEVEEKFRPRAKSLGNSSRLSVEMADERDSTRSLSSARVRESS